MTVGINPTFGFLEVTPNNPIFSFRQTVALRLRSQEMNGLPAENESGGRSFQLRQASSTTSEPCGGAETPGICVRVSRRLDPTGSMPPIGCLYASRHPEGAEWVSEVELDGYRAQAICASFAASLLLSWLRREQRGPGIFLVAPCSEAKRAGSILLTAKWYVHNIQWR